MKNGTAPAAAATAAEALEAHDTNLDKAVPQLPQAEGFVAPRERPHGALNLDHNRASQLRGWRRAIMTRAAEHSRALRVAWAFEWAIQRHGYAPITDTYLVRETGMSRNSVQEGLRHLVKIGAIIRVHERNGNRVRRLIYPCNRVQIHPTVGAWGHFCNTPRRGQNTPHRGGT